MVPGSGFTIQRLQPMVARCRMRIPSVRNPRVKLHLTNAEVGMWNAERWSRFAKSFRNKQNTFIRRSMFNVDGFVKSLKTSFDVLPAKAGIQYFQMVLDACLRRHDGISDFLRVCHCSMFILLLTPGGNFDGRRAGLYPEP